MNMHKVDVVIKNELFKEVGLVVDKCSAYTEEGEHFVRVNGALVCTEKWNEDHYLIIKANLCNEEDEILRIDHDSDKKTFDVINYETFSINCFKGNTDSVKYLEIYPKIIKSIDRKDDCYE